MRLTGWDNIEETWYMGYTWQEYDGQGFDGMCAEARFQSDGNNYFTFFNTDFINSNISLWENYGIEIKTLDSKFIGDDIARVGEVPSFEDLDTVSATAAAATNAVKELIGDTSVSEQISAAVAQKSSIQMIIWEADD
jgi:hypothetical protein